MKRFGVPVFLNKGVEGCGFRIDVAPQNIAKTNLAALAEREVHARSAHVAIDYNDAQMRTAESDPDIGSDSCLAIAVGRAGDNVDTCLGRRVLQQDGEAGAPVCLCHDGKAVVPAGEREGVLPQAHLFPAQASRAPLLSTLQ